MKTESWRAARRALVVDFELFRGDLEEAVPRTDRRKGGRPPFDHVRRGNAGDHGRTCFGGIEGQSCQARPEVSRRALVKYSKAKPRAMACRKSISPFQLSDTRTTSRSTAAMD